MTDAMMWYKEMLTALGAHNGFPVNADEPFLNLADERGHDRLVIELSPRLSHINLYAPFLEYAPDSTPEMQAYTARKLLEFNADTDELRDFIVCGDQSRQQYLLRGSVKVGVTANEFITACGEIVDRAAELSHFMATPEAVDYRLNPEFGTSNPSEFIVKG
jgi:hypothetical protein